MSELIRVPDIGSGEGEVIELFVKVGDRIEAEQSILTLESDKASMEVPAPKAGIVKSLKVKLGDRLKEGDELLELEVEGDAAPAPAAAAAPAAKAEEKPAAAPAAAAPAAAPAAASVQQVHVPDIGSSGKAQIIEIQVKVGDTVEADQSLITLESDKASMEIPSPAAGVVKAISVKLNDEVGTGDLILDLEVAGAAAASPSTSSSSSSSPSFRRSPSFTLRLLTMPALGAGTSMLALSDSSVRMLCSASIRSPTFTNSSITSPSPLPMSGTRMSSLTNILLSSPVGCVFPG